MIEDVPLGSEKLEILREIFAYAELNTRFDTSYVESICEFSVIKTSTLQAINTMRWLIYIIPLK